jgi:hypothetical protein
MPVKWWVVWLCRLGFHKWSSGLLDGTYKVCFGCGKKKRVDL